jgi:hypothetical protein
MLLIGVQPVGVRQVFLRILSLRWVLRMVVSLVLDEAALTLCSQPANDNFTNRIYLTGLSVSTQGSNIGGTREPGEPVAGNIATSSFDQSVWWSWSAPANGLLTVITAGHDFITKLAVYVGTGTLRNWSSRALMPSNAVASRFVNLQVFVSDGGIPAGPNYGRPSGPSMGHDG